MQRRVPENFSNIVFLSKKNSLMMIKSIFFRKVQILSVELQDWHQPDKVKYSKMSTVQIIFTPFVTDGKLMHGLEFVSTLVFAICFSYYLLGMCKIKSRSFFSVCQKQ